MLSTFSLIPMPTPTCMEHETLTPNLPDCRTPFIERIGASQGSQNSISHFRIFSAMPFFLPTRTLKPSLVYTPPLRAPIIFVTILSPFPVLLLPSLLDRVPKIPNPVFAHQWPSQIGPLARRSVYQKSFGCYSVFLRNLKRPESSLHNEALSAFMFRDPERRSRFPPLTCKGVSNQTNMHKHSSDEARGRKGKVNRGRIIGPSEQMP